MFVDMTGSGEVTLETMEIVSGGTSVKSSTSMIHTTSGVVSMTDVSVNGSGMKNGSEGFIVFNGDGLNIGSACTFEGMARRN